MKSGSLRRILSYTYRYKWSFVISVIGFITFAAADIAAVEWIRRIISYIDSEETNLNTLLAMSLIFIAIGRGVGFFVGNYFMSRVGFGIVHDLRAELFQKLHDLPKSYFDANQSGQLINRITFTTTQVSGAASNAVKTLVREGFLLVGLIFGGTVSALAHEYIDVTHNHELHDEEEDHHDEEEDHHDEETSPINENSSDNISSELLPANETTTSTSTVDVEVKKFNLSITEGVPEELQIIEVKLGTKAIIEINSLVNTELHIHGYDLYIDIQKDNTQELAFDFNIAGEFEIEDHNSGYEVARIRVNP